MQNYMSKFEWELLHQVIENEFTMRTSRAKIPGGWMILNATIFIGMMENKMQPCISESMIKVDDPAHKWHLEK